MGITKAEDEMIELSPSFKKFIFCAALIKAGVAGAGAGLAILGAADVAFAVTASAWLDSVTPHLLINLFAFGGGVIGVCFKLFSMLTG